MTPLVYLFVPADSRRKITKAFGSEADAVILDLEDGVAPAQKVVARPVLQEAVRALRQEALRQRSPLKPFYIRCNDVRSTHFADDLALIAELRPAGVMLPKYEEEEDIAALAEVLGEVEILPLVESVAGIRSLQRAATLPPQIKRLAFGAVDYALDLGAGWTTSGAERQFAMQQLVFLSRALELEPPLDAVFPILNDDAAFARDIQRGKELGFFGKMVIHPAQIAAVRDAYRVSEAEYSWCRRVVERYESSGGAGALELDGKLVDLPVYRRARRVLLAAGAPGDSPAPL